MQNDKSQLKAGQPMAEKFKIILICFAYLAITLYFTYPLLGNFTKILFGAQNDALGSLWGLWWAKEAIFNYGQLPFTSYLLNAPFGIFIPYVSPLNYVFSIPITAIWGAITSYNLIVLSSIFLTGIAGYLLAYHFTKNHIASFIAGLIITLSPYHITQAQSFLDLPQIQWLILYILFLFRFTEKRTGWNWFGLNLFFWLTLFVNHYYVVFAALATIIFVGVWFWKRHTLCHSEGARLFGGRLKNPEILRYAQDDTSQWSSPRLAKIFKWMMIIYGGVFLLSYGYFWFLKIKGFFPMPDFAELMGYGRARYWYWFLPADNHPILSDWIKFLRPGVSFSIQTIYLGMIPMFLGGLAIISKSIRRQSTGISFAWYFFLAIAIAGVVFSVQPLLELGKIKITLPSYFLYQAVPFIKILTRFSLLTIVSLAILSSFTLAQWLNDLKTIPKKITLILASIILIGFEFMPALPVTDLSKTPEVYQWLAEQKDDSSVMEYPFYLINSWYWSPMYYQTIHNKPIVNNYQFKALNQNHRDNLKTNYNILYDPEKAIPFLKLLGVKYIIVHTKGLDEIQEYTIKNWVNVEKFNSTSGLKRIKRFEDSEVYEIENTLPLVYANNYSIFVPGNMKALEGVISLNQNIDQAGAAQIQSEISRFPNIFLSASREKQNKAVLGKVNNISIATQPDSMKLEGDVFSTEIDVPEDLSYEIWTQTRGPLSGRMTINGNELNLSEKRENISGWQKLGDLTLSDGRQKIVIYPEKIERDLISNPSFENLPLWDGGVDRSPELSGAAKFFVKQNTDASDGKYSLEIKSESHRVGVGQTVRNIDHNSIYRLSFDYKNISGGRPQYAFWQSGPQLGMPEEPLEQSKEWKRHEIVFKPEPNTDFMVLYLFSFPDNEKSEPSINLYDNVKLEKISDNNIKSLILRVNRASEGEAPEVSYEKINSSKYIANVKNADSPFFLNFLKMYDGKWQAGIKNPETNQWEIVQDHYLVNGYANSWYIEREGSYEVEIYK